MAAIPIRVGNAKPVGYGPFDYNAMAQQSRGDGSNSLPPTSFQPGQAPAGAPPDTNAFGYGLSNILSGGLVPLVSGIRNNNLFGDPMGRNTPQPLPADPGLGGFSSQERIQGQQVGMHQAGQDADARAAAAAAAANQPTPTFQDFLGQALGMVPNMSAIYDTQIQNAKNMAQYENTGLKGAYAGLVSQIAGQTAPIGGFYDQAHNEIAANNKEAQGAVNNAYGSSSAAQNSAFDALGIGNAARGSLAASGNYAANDQANSIAHIAANSLGNQNANSEHKATAMDYNLNMGEGANAAGANAQAQILQHLGQQVAELRAQQMAVQANRFNQAIPLAQSLNSDAFNRLKETDKNAYNAQRILNAQNSHMTSKDVLGMVSKFFGGKDPSQIDPTQYLNALKSFTALNASLGRGDPGLAGNGDVTVTGN